MIRAPSRVRQNSPAELLAFDTTCERLGGFDPEISFEWIDGFLAGLAAGPRLLPAAEWVPLLCGDAFERAFADPADAEQALRSLELRLRVLCDQLDPAALMDDPQTLRLEPLMSEWSDAERERVVKDEGVAAEVAALLQTGAMWAEGFMDAVESVPGLWVEPADDESATMFGALIDQIAALLLPPDDDAYKEHVETYYPQGTPTRDEMLAEACWAAQDLRVYWVDRAPKPATRRVEATPGRNDPCPCGSGKKFKKCHGSSAADQA